MDRSSRKPEAPSANKTADRQSDKFIEAARELGCDESEEGFAEIVRKVASAHPPTAQPKAGAAKADKVKKVSRS